MANKKNTRRALFLSVMSLILCCAMLVGTTFAWFTDNVTSSNNIIKSGTLDVTMKWADGTKAIPADDSNDWKDASTGAIFDYKLWEPGYVEVRHIKIANEGTLALRYQLSIEAEGAVSKLADAIDVYYVDPAAQVTSRNELTDAYKLGTLTEVLANMPSTASGELLAGKNDTITLALKMRESAGNEYKNLEIGSSFKVVLNATQKTHENDSFGSDYDVLAQGGSTSGAAPTEGFKEYAIMSGNSNVKAATMQIHADSVEDTTKPVAISIIATDLNENIQVNTDEKKAATYEITVSNLKENNQKAVKVELNIGTGLTGVEIYHNETKIESTYNPNTGYVIFDTTSFSPYTVVYDAKVVVEDDEGGQQPGEGEGGEGGQQPGANLPVANVTEYTNTQDIIWGNFGQWSPTEGLEANLEAAYTFECADVDGAADSPYADWYCDFYVKLDRDLEENQIFLGGNYGELGWIGFHNGDVTLKANEELPLLGSVTQNPWTYQMIAEGVGTFICGVGDVDDALAGATFTVMLRLTNPENENEFYNVETIEYKFVDNKVYTADALQNAVKAGGTVKLGSDINMNGVRVDIPANSNVTLDLNGYTLTSKDGGGSNTMAVYVNRGANLTLNDSKGDGKIVASCYGVYVQPGATFTMNGGTINVSGNGVYDIGVSVWNGEFVMNDGAINAKFAVWTSNYWKNNGEPDAPTCEVTIVSGCEIASTGYADVEIKDAPDTIVDVPDTLRVYNGTETE